MAGRGGTQTPGPKRPDPAAVEPGMRPWARLMRRVFDELYEALEPAERPTLTALAQRVHLSKPYVSQVFSGKSRPDLAKFLSLVRALGGDPRQWEPYWHRAAAEQAADAGEEPPLKLPGVGDESADSDAGTVRAEPDWDLRRHVLRRLVRTAVAWAIMAATYPVRRRRDPKALRLRRTMIKQVRDKMAKEIGRSETFHYLRPRFVMLVDDDDAGTGRRQRGRKRGSPEPTRVPTRETSVRALFDDLDELVVLGRPGMGKSAQLARLAHQLAVEALDDTGRGEPLPIPVYLRLDSYRGEPIEEWLAAAARHQYESVSAKLVRSWLDERLLLPVLDGLDEVPEQDRAKCVAELRRLRGICPGIAVGCRTDEADLRRLARRMNALRYVELQPPTRQDVQDFLETDKEALKDVDAALKESEGEDLWPLLQSPLMLNFIRVAYGHRTADDLRKPGSLTERRNRIFDAYLRECLKRDEAPERTLGWLTWLARTLTGRGEHVLYLDRLDLSWLSPTERALPLIVPNVTMSIVALGLPVLWLAVAVPAGVIHASVGGAAAFALAMAITISAQAYRSEKHSLERADDPGENERNGAPRGSLVIPVLGNTPVIAFNLFWLVGLAHVDLTAPGPTVVGLGYLWVTAAQMEGAFTDVFSPVEQMRWSLRRRERMLYSGVKFYLVRAGHSVLAWLALAVLLGYVVHLLCPRPGWIAPAATYLLAVTYILGNQFEPSLQNRRPRPNEGIRRTARFSLTHGTAGFVVTGAALFLLIALAVPDDGLRHAWFVAALLGALLGVIRGFRYGGLAVLRHWTIRVVLAYQGYTPYRYRRFLHRAERHVLLLRTDSGFFFPHRLLQLHVNSAGDHLMHASPGVRSAPRS
ncbi:NACHT domain-containing protein [Streptomyces sp. NPDC050528]|uniref:NACHT domain-containing protein n=1 Tax=unclassified Streptomyces TaxID=2593676 RepID=UPI0037B70FB8